MKKTGYLLVLITLVCGSAFTIAENVCKSYFPRRAGSSLEYTMYNDKNKVSGKMVQKVKSVSDIPNGIAVDMSMTFYDDKDKQSNTGEYKMRCEGDKYYVDMSNMLSPEARASSQSMQMEMESSYLEFPSNPKAGQTLPNGKMDAKMKVDGSTFMTMTISVTDRKVEGFEDVTTPAGTFKCVKYSDRTEIKSIISMKTRNIAWVAEDVGNVKSESYNDKGKMVGSMLLTKFEK